VTKKLAELTPRSASTVAPTPTPVHVSPPTGWAMTLDDLPGGVRSAHLEESLERDVLAIGREEEVPARAVEVAVAASTAVSPSPPPPEIKPRATKMIATPIDASLRDRLRELRGSYSISEAFVVETALRTFFADRTLADVASDLRIRGGRLRRSKQA